MTINLEDVENKLRSLEIKERQKYNYYCARTNNCWNWTKEQDEQYQEEWDKIIEEMHILQELKNAMLKAKKYL